jgi:diguanylate cyclase (GGDEF)-like protein
MRNRLILTIFIVCLIPFIIGGVYLKTFIEKWLYSNSIEESNQILQQVSALIDQSFISDMNEQVNMLASLDCVMNANQGINDYTSYNKDTFSYKEYAVENEIENIFLALKESNLSTNFIFMGTENGGYLEYPRFSPNESYDPRLRPWYTDTINRDGIVISEPYITNVTNEMVVSFTKQVVRDNEVIGVVGVSVKLGALTDSISQIRIGESGFVLLMSPQNKFIVSPYNRDWILKTPEELGLTTFEKLTADSETYYIEELDGIDRVINCLAYQENGLHIITVINKDEIIHKAGDITRILVGIYIITFVLIFIIIYQITKRITRPILEFSSIIKRMTDFDFDDSGDIARYRNRSDEIGIVASALIEMHDKINLYLAQLTSRNKEIVGKNDLLTASEEELTAQLEEINQQKEYIDFLAYHDPLTELPNRRRFIDILSCKVYSGQKGAVILLDLDDFKGINDIRGHVFGDRVLESIAKRFNEISDSHLFISRFGGDEFLFLIDYENDKCEIDYYVKQISDLFNEKIKIDDIDIEIRYSMGIALYPEDSVDVDQLIMEADLAMYSVKNSGKNGYMYFDASMMDSQLKKSNIESILREAITNDGFKIVYQPQIEVKTGQITGYEALLRLKDHNLSPAEFIEVAENNGLIIKIGRIVTEKVVKQLFDWRNAGLDIKPVSINFSANQLHDGDYIKFVHGLLEEHALDARFIEIEITENIFLENKQITLAFLKQLTEMGIKISIDDFGTGYSSLNYLTFLPVDIIKLDRSLNIKFLENQNAKVMESLISLVHSLGLSVVAEGIETVEQVKLLQQANCDYIQGYYFSRPLEADQIPVIHSSVYRNY